jgi:hypothetical protein
MKRIMILLAFVALTFSSCAQLANLINPIVGTWELVVLGTNTTQTYSVDGPCTETVTILGVGVSQTGTWRADDNAIYRKWADGSTNTSYFWFNSDRTQMTLTDTSTGISTIFTRK